MAVGHRYPVEKAATIKLEDLVVSSEEIDKNNVKGKDGKLPRANDLYFSILRCCHMGMINSILNSFSIKPSEELQPKDKDQFLEALKHGYNFFARPMAGSGYLVRTKDDPTKEAKQVTPQEPKKPAKEGEQQIIVIQKGLNYFEVTPILFEDYHKNPDYVVEEMTDFDDAMRTYFENVQLVTEENADNYQAQAYKKYENIKSDQENRLRVIQESIDDNYIKAQLIENNIAEIQAIIDVDCKANLRL